MTAQAQEHEASCTRCVYGLTCSYPNRERRGDCLDGWEFKHFEYGDPMVRLQALQWSGEINIVLGGEGEHEVNANWTLSETYKRLDHVCNECGGVCWKEKPGTLIVDKTYGGAFTLEWVDGKLARIHKETRQQPKTLWWEAK